MKNISYVISGVLAVAIIILFILFFSSKSVMEQNDTSSTVGAGDSTDVTLPVAYVDVDTLLTHYEFAKVSGERLMSKFKSSENSLAQKQQQLQKEAMEFERKIQSNAFLSQERAQQESQRLQKMDADLNQMAQRLDNELTREQIKINEQITDSVRICLEEFNRTAKYQIIFSNKSMNNILLAKDKYNVTQQVLKLLNDRYKSGQAK